MNYAFRLVNRCLASLAHEPSHVLDQLRWYSGKPDFESVNDMGQKRRLLLRSPLRTSHILDIGVAGIPPSDGAQKSGPLAHPEF